MKIIAPDLARSLIFLPSLAVADTTIVAVDPLSWAHGFGDDFAIDASTNAVIHAEDETPTTDIGSAVAPVRSMWQTQSIAMRLIAEVAFAPRRANAAAWVQGVNW